MKRKALFHLTARISFLVAALLLASGTFSYFFSLSRLRESTFRNNIEVLRQTEFLVATALGVIVRNAYSAAIHQSVVNASHHDWDDPGYQGGLERVSKLLRDRVMSSYYIHSMCLYSRLNDTVITDRGIFPLVSFPDREVVEEFYRSDKMSSWAVTEGGYPGTIGKKPVIGFLVRVPIELVTAPGILVVNVDEGLLYQTVVAVNQRFLGDIFVLDERGVIISHGDKSMLSSRFMDTMLPDDSSKSSGYLIYETAETANRRVFVSYITSPYNGWRYVAIKDYDSVIGDNRELVTIYIGAALAFVLVGVSISLIMSHRYYRPIGEIVNQIAGMSADGAIGRKEGDGNEFQFIRSSIRKISERFEHSRSLLKEHFLIDLLMGRHFDGETLKRRFEYYELDLSMNNYIVEILHIPDKAIDATDNEQLFLYTVGAKAEEIIGSRCRGIVVNRGWHELVLILNFPNRIDRANAARTANNIAAALSGNLTVSLNSSVVIGIGGFYADITDIGQSYREALEALRYEGIAGSGAIIRIGDIRRHGFPHESFLRIEAEKERLLKDFKAGRFAQAREAVAPLVRRITEDRRLNVPYKSTALFGIAGGIIAIAMNGQGHSSEILDGNLDPIHIFSRLKTPEQVIAWFHELIDKSRIESETAPKSGARDIAESVEEYLRNHHHEVVDLSDIADMVGFNINYLGRVFKERTGKTLFEYLTDLRVQAACAQLSETDKPVKIIAQETGFINKRNIARAFKRRLGLAPTEYRAQAVIKRLSGVSRR